mmetsp:Transcript_35103/g.48969  ORF Transcript_35103/g.48969 Transcript_35103/m.48969 type:complete len:263 (-) Transcript_35103:104-892(-)
MEYNFNYNTTNSFFFEELPETKYFNDFEAKYNNNNNINNVTDIPTSLYFDLDAPSTLASCEIPSSNYEGSPVSSSPVIVKQEEDNASDSDCFSSRMLAVLKTPAVCRKPNSSQFMRTVDHTLTDDQITQIILTKDTNEDQSANFWTKDLDIFLFKCAFDTRLDWKKTSKRINKETSLHTTPAQVRDRYHSLKSQSKSFKRERLTFSDDVEIYKVMREFGLDWPKINAALPQYSPLGLRNRVYNKIKKDLKYQAQLEEAILAQ